MQLCFCRGHFHWLQVEMVRWLPEGAQIGKLVEVDDPFDAKSSNWANVLPYSSWDIVSGHEVFGVCLWLGPAADGECVDVWSVKIQEHKTYSFRGTCLYSGWGEPIHLCLTFCGGCSQGFAIFVVFDRRGWAAAALVGSAIVFGFGSCPGHFCKAISKCNASERCNQCVNIVLFFGLKVRKFVSMEVEVVAFAAIGAAAAAWGKLKVDLSVLALEWESWDVGKVVDTDAFTYWCLHKWEHLWFCWSYRRRCCCCSWCW